MIRIYDVEEWFTKVPKENVIYNVEAYFDLYGEIPDTKEIRFILNFIEQGEYINGTRFKDRFGGTLYYSELSTGSKCAILASLVKDEVINFIEAANNVLQAIIILNMDCTILLPRANWLLLAYGCNECEPPEEVDIEVIGDKIYHNIRDYREEW